MTEKVLIVDDDPNVLKAYERRLRRRFEVETALCSEEGVTAVDFLGPFAVIVSDMNMPRENGAEFLAKILKTAPDSVRIMLTGNADQQTAAEAINKGRVFRFLNKPCEAEALEAAIEEGIAEYRRVTSERELLSQTLVGAVDLLSKVLAITSPEAFGRSGRLKQTVSAIAAELDWDDAWRHETAALLSPIGSVATPAELLAKQAAGKPLTDDESRILASQPEVASELISAIPRLEGVAAVVAAQDAERFTNEQEEETDGPRSSVAFGVRLLRLVSDYDKLIEADELAPQQALRLLDAEDSAGLYDNECLDALGRVAAARESRVLADVMIEQLLDGMHLVADVTTTEGALLVAKGVDVTPPLRKRLKNYAASHEIDQPLQVLAPVGLLEEAELQPA